jgi:hypothetical protein
MGAPLLTDALRATLEADLGVGVRVAVTGQRAKVSRRSLDRWLASGKVTRPPPRRLPEPPADRPVPQVLALAEPGLVAGDHPGRAARLVAGRGQDPGVIVPGRWAKREPGAAGLAQGAFDAFAEVDELAVRRRAAFSRPPDGLP